MSKHTPGPWATDVFPLSVDIRSLSNPLIAVVQSRHCNSPEELLENARLIAAAPEMLDALKKTSEFLHHMWCSANINEYDFEMVEETMLINDAAIAKATGDQP